MVSLLTLSALTLGAKGIAKLPIETLTQIFSYGYYRDPATYRFQNDIKNVRLTSRRFCEASSPLLIDFVRVYITSVSLEHLEAISKHPIFGKTVKTVEINVSFYDTALVRDRALFAYCCAVDLSQECEMWERSSSPDFDMKRLYSLTDEWKSIGSDSAWWTDSNNSSALLKAAHDRYRGLFEDQEAMKEGNAHLCRLSNALERLHGLSSIVVSDRERERGYWRTSDAEQDIQDEQIIQRFMTAYRWKGRFGNSDRCQPPTSFLFDLFNVLHSANIRPVTFEMKITPPNDLGALECDDRQLQTISEVMGRATDVSVSVERWARKDSFAEDNSRPYNEIVHLARLTTAIFSSRRLKFLKFSFGDFPTLSSPSDGSRPFVEPPQIRMSELLPITAWPDLRSLSLSHIPMSLSELAGFVERQQDTVFDFRAEGLWLFDGTWANGIEVLQGLRRLNNAALEWPKGGELGRDYHAEYKAERVRDFIMGSSSINPLRGKAWNSRF